MNRVAWPVLIGLACTSFTACAGGGRRYETHQVSPTRHASGPRILVVVAHPDDEIAFGGTLYKTSALLDGACDIALITNGEAGYKYSTLAEPLYGKRLTDPEVGRRWLPSIRKSEFLSGCAILQVRNAYLLEQKDHRYTQDVNEILGAEAGVWDLEFVSRALQRILQRGSYDFVLTLSPTPGTHGHHKAATIMALRAVRDLPPDERPVILCVGSGRKPAPPSTDSTTAAADPSQARPEEPKKPFTGLEGFPLTRLRTDVEPFEFDRTQPFGFKDRLDLRIVINWAITAHKSQGTMQRLAGRGELEHYSLYELNGPEAESRARELFDRLRAATFPSRDYDDDPGAGTAARR